MKAKRCFICTKQIRKLTNDIVDADLGTSFKPINGYAHRSCLRELEE